MSTLIAETPCPGCGTTGFHTLYMGKTGDRMKQTGECFTCAHWELAALQKQDVVIDGFLYSIGREPKNEDERWRAAQRKDLGMSGRRFDIEFFDGRKVTTHNLWAGGEIPKKFRDRIPNTAKFISGERANANGITCWDSADERDPSYPEYHKLSRG